MSWHYCLSQRFQKLYKLSAIVSYKLNDDKLIFLWYKLKSSRTKTIKIYNEGKNQELEMRRVYTFDILNIYSFKLDSIMNIFR